MTREELVEAVADLLDGDTRRYELIAADVVALVGEACADVCYHVEDIAYSNGIWAARKCAQDIEAITGERDDA